MAIESDLKPGTVIAIRNDNIFHDRFIAIVLEKEDSNLYLLWTCGQVKIYTKNGSRTLPERCVLDLSDPEIMILGNFNNDIPELLEIVRSIVNMNKKSKIFMALWFFGLTIEYLSKPEISDALSSLLFCIYQASNKQPQYYLGTEEDYNVFLLSLFNEYIFSINEGEAS